MKRSAKIVAGAGLTGLLALGVIGANEDKFNFLLSSDDNKTHNVKLIKNLSDWNNEVIATRVRKFQNNHTL